MAMTSASRSRSLVVAAAASIAWTHGCMPYKTVRPASVAPHAKVRVRDSVAFDVVPLSPVDGSLGVPCRMKDVEARLGPTRGDTTYLKWITRAVPASVEDSACAVLEGMTVALPPAQLRAPSIAVRRFSLWRTALVTLGTLYVLLVWSIRETCSRQRDC